MTCTAPSLSARLLALPRMGRAKARAGGTLTLVRQAGPAVDATRGTEMKLEYPPKVSLKRSYDCKALWRMGQAQVAARQSAIFPAMKKKRLRSEQIAKGRRIYPPCNAKAR